MIDYKAEILSLSRQCTLLSITRSNLYYQSKGESPLSLTLMRFIDEQFLKTPYLWISPNDAPFATPWLLYWAKAGAPINASDEFAGRLSIA